MHPSRNICLLAFVLVGIALLPGRVYAAAPPRVVGLAELAGNPVEVVISGKHLTLIHFDTGEVSMVAVGDTSIVSVTVKGPDVLLKALSSSGSTNAFIWQGGWYTQWTFTVRQNSRDPRLIIVKDLAASPGARVESRKSSEGTGEGGKPATRSTAAATASGQPASGTPASSATTSPSPQSPSAGPVQEHPKTARVPHSEACGSPGQLDHFIKTLTARQRELFGALLTEPSLTTLQALLLELSAQQRCDLLALLSAPASSARPATSAPGSIAPAPAPSEGNTHETDQARDGTTETSCGSAPQNSDSAGTIQGGTLAPAGVVFAVTPQVIDGRLFLYYVLENHSEATLLTDTLRLRIFDVNGNQLPFGINRATQDGYLGRLATEGVEYGVIAVDAAQKLLVLEWKLVGFRSHVQQLVRVEVQVP